MNNSSQTKCPKCGQPVTGADLNGLCPNCLALIGFSRLSEEKTVVLAPRDSTAEPAPALSSTLRYIGDYELLEEMARGGMGVVYRARQKSLNRLVAVKMILAGQFAGPEERKRFQREAEASAQLRHPNIVAIHEVGEHEGRSYFSMDLIEGRTLGAVFREGKVPAARAAALLKIVAEAVHFAHQRGTLHRDLKPGNILISPDDHPHILDFGLARQIEKRSELTQTGDIMGSPGYMPPEQAMGQTGEIGPATDVYALGAILYEAITGQPPFKGDTIADVLTQVINTDPIRPKKINPEVPADLETICLKCLEKRPERRYHSARALAEELERFLNFEPILAKPASRTRLIWSWAQQNPWVFAAFFGSLALVLGGVAYGFWEKSKLLAWRLQEGPKVPWPAMDSPARIFLGVFPGICFLLYFGGNLFRQRYRKAGLSAWYLSFHGLLGLTGTVCGMGYLLLQIRSWVWSKWDGPIMFGLELGATLCALTLNWMGFRMVWEAAGIHETSRFRKIVDKGLALQVAMESGRRWPFLKLLGFAFWLLLVAQNITLFIQAAISARKGLEWMTLGAGLAAIAVIGGVAFWTRRRERRPFVFVYAPMALIVFVLFFLTIALKTGLAPLIFLGTVEGLLLAAFSSIFFVRKEQKEPGAAVFWRNLLEMGYGLAFFLGLFLIVHLEENWRGHQAWQKLKDDMLARGDYPDFNAIAKPPVPDDQNVMAHPFMKTYFIKSSGKTLDVSPPPYRNMETQPFALADLQQMSREYVATNRLLNLIATNPAGLTTGTDELVDQIVMDKVPLDEVLLTLARQCGIQIDVSNLKPAALGKKNGEIIVNYRAEHLSALAAMEAIAREYGLAPDADRWLHSHVLAFVDVKPSLQDIEDWYKKYHHEFAQVDEALRRPSSRLYGDPNEHVTWSIPNFVSCRTLAQSYENLLQIHLVLGQEKEAMKDLRRCRRLVDVMEMNNPPTLVEAMVKISLARNMVAVLENTMAAHLWSDSRYEEIQQLCDGLNLFQPYWDSVRTGERGSVVQLIGTLQRGQHWDMLDIGDEHAWWRKLMGTVVRKAIPDGWFDQNKVTYVRWMNLVSSGVDPTTRRLDVPTIEKSWVQFEHELGKLSLNGMTHPYYYFSFVTIPNLKMAERKTAESQTAVDQAFLACALERYRIVHGAYPEQLSELVPAFAARIPLDVFDGNPLRYRKTANGKYLLYSIGWNSRDDQGEPAQILKIRPAWQEEKGDWVWQGIK